MSVFRPGGRQTSAEETWDVFVCHATEDKDVVRPLAEELRRAGLTVWYDDFVLRLGDSLREALDRGLRGSSFGVVVLSSAFFKRQWPQWELNALITRQISGRERVVIPIWHNITAAEVRAASPALADLVAASTSAGLAEVVEQVLDAVPRVALSGSSSAPPSGLGSVAFTPTTPSGEQGTARLATGWVKWWNDEKGYGFISPDEGDKDLFVHYSGILGQGFRTLTEGGQVVFEIESGDKGPKAVNVRPR